MEKKQTFTVDEVVKIAHTSRKEIYINWFDQWVQVDHFDFFRSFQSKNYQFVISDSLSCLFIERAIKPIDQ